MCSTKENPLFRSGHLNANIRFTLLLNSQVSCHLEISFIQSYLDHWECFCLDKSLILETKPAKAHPLLPITCWLLFFFLRNHGQNICVPPKTKRKKTCKRSAKPFSCIQNCLTCSYFHTPSSTPGGAFSIVSTSVKSCLMHCCIYCCTLNALSILKYSKKLVKKLL